MNLPSAVPPSVSVLIATRNRPLALAHALRSVAAQTRLPDRVIVINDSTVRFKAQTNEVVTAIEFDSLQPRVIDNDRTKNCASGAWNTGLDILLRKSEDPKAVLVAILDDDDWWEPNHIAACLEAARTSDLDMVVAGIVRHDPEFPDGRNLSIPQGLVVDDLLVGGVHIQGSNLFVRLDKLLQAGLFDEGLESATDRDLCIRLADLGDVRFGAIGEYTVHHDATAKGRLSDSGSPRRHAGLDAFWRKYRTRMSEDVARKSKERMLRLFKWRPQPLRLSSPAPTPPSKPATVALVVGITVDPERVTRIDGLLSDLRELSSDPECAGLDVVLLPNGMCEGLDELVDRNRSFGLRCIVVPPAQQVQDFNRAATREPIRRTRTMLQAYVHLVALRRPGAIAWIIDDDMRLDALVTHGSIPRRERAVHLRDLAALRDQKIDIVLGNETDSPPVPGAALVNVQMVDLVHNLHWAAALDPSAALPDRFAENLAVMRECSDYYYGLSRRQTRHLETPFWLTPACTGETVLEALERYAARLPRAMAGEQITRPVVLDLASPPPIANAFNRGGNAFIIDIDALLKPYVAPSLARTQIRRSDMVWCLQNVYCDGRRVVRAPLPLRHDRTGQPAGGLDKVFADDIRGFALYSAFEDLLNRRAKARGLARERLDFTDDDVNYALGRFKKYLRERLAALELASHRIRGAIKSAKRAIATPTAWWYRDGRGGVAVASISQTLDAVEEMFRPERVESFNAECFRFEEQALREYLSTMAVPQAAPRVDGAFFEEARGRIARAQIARQFTPGPLNELGRGSEGVVFTDGRLVYKYLDYWKPRNAAEQREFLRGLIGRWPEARILCPILDFKEDILVYAFQPSTSYTGGHGSDFLELLRECRRCGIVCRNVHPQNLIVTARGLNLIDYGGDIRPYSDAEFLQMARRAWLTWRWHDRCDLKQLMRRAIDTAIPELTGSERFLSAIDDSSALDELDRLIEEEVT